MKLTLHHINLVTENVDRMNDFYRKVLGLDRVAGSLPVLEKNQGYAGNVAFAGAPADSDEIQFHLAQKDVHAGFNSGQTVNPVSHGHIAFRTDDLAAFKAHLENSWEFPIPTGVTGQWKPGTRFSFMTPTAMSSRCIRWMRFRAIKKAPTARAGAFCNSQGIVQATITWIGAR